ncbi:hypothetical protein DY000_02020136 [Brassica cretica]|uniref:Uncharacterized protein n=1 Tax=Brassica cretica TaxID=69181 RepID=A0ABQ7E9B4_BRACR|nr:hypothetical protein DY000_02020136 [Brassica cretica]
MFLSSLHASLISPISLPPRLLLVSPPPGSPAHHHQGRPPTTTTVDLSLSISFWGGKVHGGWRRQGPWRLEDGSLVAAGGGKAHDCWKRGKAMKEAAAVFFFF